MNPDRFPATPCRRQRRGSVGPPADTGFTLLEALIASVILAMSVLAVTQAITAGHAQLADGLRRQRAIELAEAMVEEITARPHDDPDGASALGPDAGESGRGDFDNRDDYHGLSETPGLLADAFASPLPEPYQGFNRAVSITDTTVSLGPLGSQPALVVTVTVSLPDGRSWPLTRILPEPID